MEIHFLLWTDLSSLIDLRVKVKTPLPFLAYQNRKQKGFQEKFHEACGAYLQRSNNFWK